MRDFSSLDILFDQAETFDQYKTYLFFEQIRRVFSLNKKLESLTLAGYLALIAFSGKAYRTPHDIDLLISPDEILSFVKIFLVVEVGFEPTVFLM